MFDWLGWRTGMPLWWSYRLNSGMKEDVEESFEGIAQTRKALLQSWADDCWGHLERLASQLVQLQRAGDRLDGLNVGLEPLFRETYTRAGDFTELFMLDTSGRIVHTTCGERANHSSEIGRGLIYTEAPPEGQKCLYGPYADPVTLALGPRSSAFHDKMTLMFLLPLSCDGKRWGTLCGRVPNDVIGDLIQRESGHIYPDSGDNYIFMAKPGLQTDIQPGTALSRSRFEDRTFTHGENLKDGITTAWGTVTVTEHTELELIFTDPSTGELHPGVANTIRNGSNLYVEFPGYSDYRHIPVIGKGVTFQLPHCPDVWGMMCEGDLEEVYRLRSISYRQNRLHSGLAVLFTFLMVVGMYVLLPLVSVGTGAALAGLITAGYGILSIRLLHRRSSLRVVQQLRNINRFIRINAEGSGDLTQRLDTGQFDQDEIRELAKWINNMIDSLEGIMLQVKMTAGDVLSSQTRMSQSTSSTEGTAHSVNQKIHEMIGSLRHQLKDIEVAKDVANQMRSTLWELEEQASGQIAVARSEVDRIGDKMDHIALKVKETNNTITAFMETMQEIQNVLHVIEEISSQTNLLALNASIEAARVGEHGKGFNVVATEIRKLAERTKESTDHVKGIVQQIYSSAGRAFASMEEGNQVVAEGTALVSAASELLGGAQAEDTLKTRVVDEVVTLMEQIAAVSIESRRVSIDVEYKLKELAHVMNHARNTSGHVEAIAGVLQQLVGQFRLTDTRRR
ncbi:methyl-accepting chemotaxis protein [Paenibacillus sp. GCM10012307]|uniref:Methyl-accepting chemotaxis protein n=1 Tax=Paenibacillus roseus TaxID=2798579 RepID=A0A934MR05_9BACL|nr:methyl-accepting chemotaxis protein [Paenibacillus roseus]MBJ6363731.1 methyl-accepting chemotaxis protein [Paenibacillus roseus]